MSVSGFRSLLFVPGTRPDRFTKAMAAGADAICIDLEDAVPPDAKAEARSNALAFLDARARMSGSALAIGLRVNGLRDADGLRDLAALADVSSRPDFLMVPKVSDRGELSILAERFHGLPLWAIIESAAGLHHAHEIAGAPGLAGLMFGGADYAADLGCALTWEALLHARGTLAAARAMSRVELLDVPHLDLKDENDLAQSTQRAKQLGFTGRACIHPVQLAAVNRAFTPTEQEAGAARRLLEAFAAAKGGVTLLDGKLVERPFIINAERLLARIV